jgi:hypothetical protein
MALALDSVKKSRSISTSAGRTLLRQGRRSWACQLPARGGAVVPVRAGLLPWLVGQLLACGSSASSRQGWLCTAPPCLLVGWLSVGNTGCRVRRRTATRCMQLLVCSHSFGTVAAHHLEPPDMRIFFPASLVRSITVTCMDGSNSTLSFAESTPVRRMCSIPGERSSKR